MAVRNAIFKFVNLFQKYTTSSGGLSFSLSSLTSPRFYHHSPFIIASSLSKILGSSTKEILTTRPTWLCWRSASNSRRVMLSKKSQEFEGIVSEWMFACLRLADCRDNWITWWKLLASLWLVRRESSSISFTSTTLRVKITLKSMPTTFSSRSTR